MSDTVDQLQQQFVERQADMMSRAAARQRRNRRNLTIAGAMTGLAAVMVTAGFTRKAILWHSFLLEALFCGVAGYLLARLHGGFFKGVLLFSFAYLLAFYLRGTTFDITVVFSQGDIQGRAAVQGNFMSLCMVVGTGGVVGLMAQE